MAEFGLARGSERVEDRASDDVASRLRSYDLRPVRAARDKQRRDALLALVVLLSLLGASALVSFVAARRALSAALYARRTPSAASVGRRAEAVAAFALADKNGDGELSRSEILSFDGIAGRDKAAHVQTTEERVETAAELTDEAAVANEQTAELEEGKESGSVAEAAVQESLAEDAAAKPS